MSETQEDVPPIEPQKQEPQEATQAVLTSPPPKPVASGASLIPDFGTDQPGARSEYVYWVGVLPTCPVSHIDCAGVNFPKMNELILPDPSGDGSNVRKPVLGTLVKLDRRKLDLLANRIGRTVIRFRDPKGPVPTKDRYSFEDIHTPPRQGRLITIPSAKEIEERQRHRRALHQYTPHALDEPAADYMFCVLCSDQGRPTHGEYTPDPLSKTGLFWPEEN